MEIAHPATRGILKSTLRAIAVPITCLWLAFGLCGIFRVLETAYLCNICRDDSCLCKHIENEVQPAGKMSLAILRQVHARDCSELDTQRLQEDGKDVGKKDHEEKTKAEGRAGRYIRCIVAYSNTVSTLSSLA
jgi:hypothetical protein